MQDCRTGYKLSSQKSGRCCYFCNTFLREEEETEVCTEICKKRSGKGSVSSESPGGQFVIEIKASSDCEQSGMSLGLSLGVFGKIYFLKFWGEMLSGMFLKEEVRS